MRGAAETGVLSPPVLPHGEHRTLCAALARPRALYCKSGDSSFKLEAQLRVKDSRQLSWNKGVNQDGHFLMVRPAEVEPKLFGPGSWPSLPPQSSPMSLGSSVRRSDSPALKPPRERSPLLLSPHRGDPRCPWRPSTGTAPSGKSSHPLVSVTATSQLPVSACLPLCLYKGTACRSFGSGSQPHTCSSTMLRL